MERTATSRQHLHGGESLCADTAATDDDHDDDGEMDVDHDDDALKGAASGIKGSFLVQCSHFCPSQGSVQSCKSFAILGLLRRKMRRFPSHPTR